MRILLVEDSRTDILLVERMLRQEYQSSLSIDSVGSLEEAGRTIAGQRYDVILLDLNLPDSAGLSTFERVHALLNGTPTILLTGTDDDGIALDAVRTGAQDYVLKKELNGRMLRRSITYAVERQQLVQQLHDRVNEMTCLHKLAELLQDTERPQEELVAAIANLLPSAFQYPDSLRVSLRYGDLSIAVEEEIPAGSPVLEESFLGGNGCEARLRVWYAQESSVANVEPFLPEEAALLHTVMEMMRSHCDRREALQQLREQKALLSGVVDAMPVGVWLFDANGGVITSNKTSERITGGMRHESLAELSNVTARWTQSGAPLSFEDWPGARALLQGESVENQLIDIDHPRGETITILGSAVPFSTDGVLQCAIVTGQDATELKKAQDEVRSAAEQRLSILNALPANILLLGRDGRIMAVNEGWKLFMHANDYAHPEAGIGEPYLKVLQEGSGFSPEESPFVSTGIRSVLEGHMPHFTIEYPWRRGDRLRWFRVTVHPLVRGQLQGAVVMYLDITARKLAEEDLRQQKELLQKIFDNIPVMLAMLDPRGMLQWVNRAWEHTLGWALEDVRDKDLYSLLENEPQARPAVEFEALVRPKDGWNDFLIRTKDGRALSTSWATIKLSDGSTINIGQDLTQRRLLEEQLMQAQKMEGIGRLAGGVAHDFNNLLSAILGYADFALTALDDSNPVRADIEQIQKAGVRATDLTRQLLAFARRQLVEMRIVDVSALVIGLNRLLRRVIGEDIELVILTEPDLHKVRVDPGQLEQVLMNLAVNARDAMPNGGKLTIATRNVELGPQYERTYGRARRGKHVEIQVSDTGSGMSAEVISHAFEPFFTTKEVGKGTGLGLATCYGIVKQAEGDIWIQSTPPMGTEILIYLPAASPAAAGAESVGAERSIVGGTETLLVVEDEPLVREMVDKALSKLGYRVLVAENGPEALRIAATFPEQISLLLTDVVMPHMGGKEVAERIRAKRTDIRILFMSGYTEDAVLRKGFANAERAFLAKPFTARALARRVRDVLDHPLDGESVAGVALD